MIQVLILRFLKKWKICKILVFYSLLEPWLVLKRQLLSTGFNLSWLLRQIFLFFFYSLLPLFDAYFPRRNYFFDWVQCIDSLINVQWFDEESIETSLPWNKNVLGHLYLLIWKETDMKMWRFRQQALCHFRISWGTIISESVQALGLLWHSKWQHYCLNTQHLPWMGESPCLTGIFHLFKLLRKLNLSAQ